MIRWMKVVMGTSSKGKVFQINIFLISILLPLQLSAKGNNLSNNEKSLRLMDCVRSGKYTEAKKLLNDGADINFRESNYGFTPLHSAIRGEYLPYDRLLKGEHLDFAIYLIKRGADISSKNRYGYLAVHYAAGCLFLKDALDYNFDEKRFFTPYLDEKYGNPQCNKTLNQKYLQLLEVLEKHGADFNSKNSIGVMPIHVAALSGSYKVFEYVAQRTHDLSSAVTNGSNALVIAIQYQTKTTYMDNLQMIQLLINSGVNVNQKLSNMYYETTYCINEAVKVGYPEIVELLLKKGANPNFERISYKQGGASEVYADVPLTSLAGANIINKIEVGKLLLKYGANINYADSFGWNALHHSIAKNDVEIVAFLLKNGVQKSSNIIKARKLFEVKKDSVTAKELSAIIVDNLKSKLSEFNLELKMTELANKENVKEKLTSTEYAQLKDYFEKKGFFRETDEIKLEITQIKSSLKSAETIDSML